MKKIYTYLAMTIIALTTLTSCDQDAWDREDARTLDGTWTGYIDVYYADRWGWTGDTYRTSICFVRENPYGGYGYEADYDTNYHDVAYSEFRWEITNGRAYIEYADPRWNPIVMYYSIASNGNYLQGRIDDGVHSDIRFQLYYDGNYNWGRWQYYDDYYYAPRRAASADSTTISHMGGKPGTNYFATGKFAERLRSLDAQSAAE